ncbi:hypothetical protein [Ottowia thiooxydans]|uniref:Uncharacterized protein n=1 Tax=Ottowia thiooxydans TaxID=219182 RepID=A0ABV2Q605_9BURK
MTKTKQFIQFLSGVVLVLSAPAVTNAQAVLDAPRPAAVPQNALAVASQNVGIKTCRPALERLSTLAVNGTRGNDVLLDWDRQRVDAGPVFSLIGLEYPNGGAAMSVTAVPTNNGGCSVAAERISAAPVSCQAVAQQELKGMTATRLLPTFTVFTDAKDPTATVSLIDTPPGCLVIRRYVEFNWRAPR